jgi:hypothetical protein
MLIAVLSVIICDFYIEGIAFLKSEADAPLVIDRNGVLTFSISRQLMESIPRRNAKVVETPGEVNEFQFSAGAPHDIRRKSSAPAGRV